MTYCNFNNDMTKRDIKMQDLQKHYTDAFSYSYETRNIILDIYVMEFNVDGNGGVLLEKVTAKKGKDNKADVKMELKIVPFSKFEELLRNQEQWNITIR